MTLEQCYQQNEGQALLIPGGGKGNNGQCAQWADTVLHDVYGQPYVYTPGAIDWYLNAEALGLTKHFDRINDGSVRRGDFVVFGSGVGSVYGHINVAAQDGNYKSYVGYDSNWGRKYNAAGYPILHTVVHNDSYNQYIIGILRLKGEVMTTWSNGETYNLLYQSVGLGAAEQAKKANYVGYFGLQDGREFKQAFYEIINSLQYGMMVQEGQKQKDFTKVGNIDGIGDVFKKG